MIYLIQTKLEKQLVISMTNFNSHVCTRIAGVQILLTPRTKGSYNNSNRKKGSCIKRTFSGFLFFVLDQLIETREIPKRILCKELVESLTTSANYLVIWYDQKLCFSGSLFSKTSHLNSNSATKKTKKKLVKQELSKAGRICPRKQEWGLSG